MIHECAYPNKRRFLTRIDAEHGAQRIKAAVEAAGRRYDQLYPYQCPNADHWHLSSKEQGVKVCTGCNTEQSAWRRGNKWIVYAHGDCDSRVVETIEEDDGE